MTDPTDASAYEWPETRWPTIPVSDACDALDALARRTHHPEGLIHVATAKRALHRAANAQINVPRQRDTEPDREAESA